jgi:hypothetical protein
MSGVTGDFAGLDALRGALEGLEDVVPRICDRAGEKIEAAVDAQFAAGTDPYGAPWAPLASGAASHLTKSGGMRASVVVVVGTDRIETIVADPAGYHQTGTRHMPARPVIPTEAKGLPDTWDAAITDAGLEVLDEAWGR